VDAQSPGLEVGEHPVGSGQDDMGGHDADHMGLVMDVRGLRVDRPAVGLGDAVRSDAGRHESMQRGGGEIPDWREAEVPGVGACRAGRAAPGRRPSCSPRAPGPLPPGRLGPRWRRRSGRRRGRSAAKTTPLMIATRKPAILCGHKLDISEIRAVIPTVQ